MRKVSAPYSVLMAVYGGDNPTFFREAIDSIMHQTVPTDDFVIVCDGPLTNQLDAVIEEALRKDEKALKILRLPKNGGLGDALAYGITKCKHEIVLRADSDDISFPERAEKQVDFISRNCLDICSTPVVLFSNDKSQPIGTKNVPVGYREIVRRSKRRSPFNHPSVCFKKASVVASGNYKKLYLTEDYYLWIRMLAAGFKADNMQEPLVWMRVNTDTVGRRASKKTCSARNSLNRYMFHIKYIKLHDFLLNYFENFARLSLPKRVKKFIFQRYWTK